MQGRLEIDFDVERADVLPLQVLVVTPDRKAPDEYHGAKVRRAVPGTSQCRLTRYQQQQQHCPIALPRRLSCQHARCHTFMLA
jgi:hypothetical protein